MNMFLVSTDTPCSEVASKQDKRLWTNEMPVTHQDMCVMYSHDMHIVKESTLTVAVKESLTEYADFWKYCVTWKSQ